MNKEFKRSMLEKCEELLMKEAMKVSTRKKIIDGIINLEFEKGDTGINRKSDLQRLVDYLTKELREKGCEIKPINYFDLKSYKEDGKQIFGFKLNVRLKVK